MRQKRESAGVPDSDERTDGNEGAEVDVVQLQTLVFLEVIRNLKK